MYLFVYGTLKRGESRHPYLAGQKFLAPARTQPQYRLYDLGDYPGLVEHRDGRSVEGELWDVDPECLARLDIVEGCDEALYRRSTVRLASPHDHLPVFSYFYEKPVSGLQDCGMRW